MIETLVRSAIVEEGRVPTSYFLSLFQKLVRALNGLMLNDGLSVANLLFSNLGSTRIDTSVQSFTTAGYSAVGVGAATYKRTASTGATAYRAQSSDGSWWVLAEPNPLLEQVGGSASALLAYGASVRQADDAAQTSVTTITLDSDQHLIGADLKTTLTSGSAWLVGIASGAVNAGVGGGSLEGQSTGPGALVHLNQPNAKTFSVIGVRFNGPGSYGILDNAGASGGDGAVYAFNDIKTLADCACLNHPSVTVSRRLVLGNVLETLSTGSSSSYGFAVSVANTDGYIVAFNMVRSSRLEAFHIEDGQHRGIILGNTAASCSADGVHILKASVSQGDADPVIVVAQHLRSGNGVGTGLRAVYDSNGTQAMCVWDDNIVRDFATAMDQGGQPQAIGVNVSYGCATVLKGAKNSWSAGRHYVLGAATTLFSGEATSKGGKFLCTARPTNFVTKVGSDYPGPWIEGVRVPFSYSHPGGSTYADFKVCTMPSHFAGRLTIATDDHAASAIFYTAVITWDGTTLSVQSGSGFTKNQGDMQFTGLSMSGSDLRFQFFGNGVAHTGTAWAEFDGVWYQHT